MESVPRIEIPNETDCVLVCVNALDMNLPIIPRHGLIVGQIGFLNLD